MPATATRSRETAADTRESLSLGPSIPIRELSPDFAQSLRVSNYDAPAPNVGVEVGIETPQERETDIEWREVAPLVDRFTHTPIVHEGPRKRRRGLHRRHRNFVMSGVFWVGLLLSMELVGLVFLYSIDLRAIRYDKALQTDIDKTSLDIALAQNQLAASVSPAKLDIWAAQLGYRKAKLNEMDDVTSSTPASVVSPDTAP